MPPAIVITAIVDRTYSAIVNLVLFRIWTDLFYSECGRDHLFVREVNTESYSVKYYRTLNTLI